MDTNLIDDLSKITGKQPEELQEIIGKLTLDQLYSLLDSVNNGSEYDVKQMIDTYANTNADGELTDNTDGDSAATPAPQPAATSESIDFAVKCKKDSLHEAIVEFLEEQGIPFSFRPGNTILVSCQNNAQADHIVSMVERAGTKKKEDESMSKKHKVKVPESSKPRDPMARELAKGQYQPKVTPNKKAMLEKSQTKHKAKGLDEAFSSVAFWVDNAAAYDTVLESFGSDVSFDGENFTADKSTWTRIEESLTTGGYESGTDFGRKDMTKKTVQEGVLGMTPMPGLRRMMELAGMAADQIDQLAPDAGIPTSTEVVPAQPATAEINAVMDANGLPTGDDDMDLGIDGGELDGDDIAGDDLGLDDPAPAGDFADAVVADDMGMGMGMDMGDEAALSGSDASPAFTLINDALASVQNSLPDVKISEYKTLIQRLEELTNQLRQVGQSYLGD
jgi:hypothetical protein